MGSVLRRYICLFISSMHSYYRKPQVPKVELQLVGITCMLITAKYEELQPPTPKDYSFITNHTYTPEQVLDMEISILATIQFQISAVTSLEFSVPYQCDHPLVSYLLELALTQPICLIHKPSHLAVRALMLPMFAQYSARNAGPPLWQPGPDIHSIRPCPSLCTCAICTDRTLDVVVIAIGTSLIYLLSSLFPI